MAFNIGLTTDILNNLPTYADDAAVTAADTAGTLVEGDWFYHIADAVIKKHV